jgi:hypothetical protein
MDQQLSLFPNIAIQETTSQQSSGRTREQVKRIDLDQQTRKRILPLCRLRYGEIWEDPVSGHRIGVLDATKLDDVKKIMDGEGTPLIINDPPYNVEVGNANTHSLPKINLETYLDFSRKWVSNAITVMESDAHLYVWMGTDYKDGFQPLQDFMIMMRDFKQIYHYEEPERVWNSEKLDVGKTGTPILCPGKSKLLRRVYRYSQSCKRILQRSQWEIDGEYREK